MDETVKSRFHLLAWLPAGVALIVLAWLLDGRVDDALDATGQPELKRLAWWASQAGEGWVIGVAGFFLTIVFLLLKRSQAAANIFYITLASEITGGVASVLRLFFGRTRPSNHTVPQGFYGLWHDGTFIAGKYQFSSFPSGHSASAAGLAVAVWLIHRGWGSVAAVYALAVMWSRIALECHHFSDVVASVVVVIPVAIFLNKRLAPALRIKFDQMERKRGGS